MKKIIALIMCALSILLIANHAEEVHAILVEQEITFSVTSYTATTNTKYYKFNFNKNMFELLDSLYRDLTEDKPGTINGVNHNWYETTIKMDGVSYPAYVSRSYQSLYDSERYRIQVQLNLLSEYAVLSIYEKPITYNSTAASPSFSVDLTPSSGFIELAGTVGYYPNRYTKNYSLSEFIESDIEPGDGTPITNFSELPSTLGTLVDAKDLSKVGRVYFEYASGNLFNTYVFVGGQQYNLGLIDLPGVEELNKQPLSPGIYWTENNKRYIYYEFQNDASDIPVQEQLNMFLDDPNKITGFRPFVMMNLSDETYTFTDKLQLYAGYYGGPNGQAYADVVFPFELDDLLSIEIYYSYRWEVLWGLSYTAWEYVQVGRHISEVVDMRNTWDHLKWLVTPLGYYQFFTEEVPSWFTPQSPTIQPVVITPEYKSTYLANINTVRSKQGKSPLNMEAVFPNGANVYRVYLDTYSNGLYTGYQIGDEIIILDVMYKYDGQVYHVPYDDIDNGGSFGGGGPGLGGQPQDGFDLSKWFQNLFKDIPGEYILAGVGILVLVTWGFWEKLFKNIGKIVKNPKNLLIAAGVIFAIAYLLGLI